MSLRAHILPEHDIVLKIKALGGEITSRWGQRTEFIELFTRQFMNSVTQSYIMSKMIS